MKASVIYDSQYGNTEKIAQAIGRALETQAEVSVFRVEQVRYGHLAGIDLLVVGSPTQRFNPTLALGNFLKSIPSQALKDVKVAAFDTRLAWEAIQTMPPLPFLERIFGYAASRIGKLLQRKGGRLVTEPEGFFVEGMEGPLSAGELERAEIWAKKLFV